MPQRDTTGIGERIPRELIDADFTVAFSLVEMASLLPKDDPELVAVLRRALIADGVALYEGHKVLGAEASGAGVALEIQGAEGSSRLEGSHLLVVLVLDSLPLQ